MRIREYLKGKPTFFFVAAILVLCFVKFLNPIYGVEPKDILTEFNGLVFDLIVIGLILEFYSAIREKKDKIERYKEEIEDYRGWKENEASYRTAGAIRRLKRLGVTKIHLENSFLHEADLFDAIIIKSSFRWATLTKTSFLYADLRRSSFEGADLRGASFQEADLRGAYLTLAKIDGTSFNNTKMDGVTLGNFNREMELSDLPSVEEFFRSRNAINYDHISENYKFILSAKMHLMLMPKTYQDEPFSFADITGCPDD